MANKLGEDSLKRILPEAARLIQEAIEEAGGLEVFFTGALDAAGRVASVRVCARGNASAVPALFDGLDIRDVVLHNHPSGDLEPSEADLDLAAIYTAHGHGVYIVDNAVTRVYVVVEPFLPKDAKPLDTRMLGKFFAPDGPLARALPGYEVRPQQTRMMEKVGEAFNQAGVVVVEAPTGVGKTMAYLLPAALWAMRNKERVVISTRTINLQEQIIHKDIPLLQRCLKEKFTACLVKGRGNYVCLRKLDRALSEATLFDDAETQDQLDSLAAWAAKTEDGSRSDLPFMPGRDLWDRVCSEADSCGMGRCPDQKRCFVGKARREIAKADLIVVNHHMLFSDIAIKMESGDFSAMAVLPAYKRLIFDEAHSIEDSATEYFGISATWLGALATLGRFRRIERGRERGLLPLIKARLVKDCPQLSLRAFEDFQKLMDEGVAPAVEACRDTLEAAFTGLRKLTEERCRQIGRDIKWRLTEDVLADEALRTLHAERVIPAVEQVGRLARYCHALAARLEKIPLAPNAEEPPLLTETTQLTAYARRLERLANALAEGTSEELRPNTVRWIEIDARNEKVVRVVRCPLEVGQPLAEWVYDNLRTVVMTSATLTVQQEFTYLFNRIGLDRVSGGRVEALALDSPFAFDSQALLCIPEDVAAPDEDAFLEESVECVRQALRITRGHAFVLYTSFYALDFAHKRLEDELRDAGITPLKQGEADRTQLLERFRSDPASVLFATDSFWEGVDVAGESLQCVILPKLPFRVPTEPIQQARAEAIQSAGGNAFMDYSVPQAVIKFRQGFGRLIRHRTDRGAILVLDRRIVTKDYGRIFLESLPPTRTVRGDRRRVFAALTQFFGGQDSVPETAHAGDDAAAGRKQEGIE